MQVGLSNALGNLGHEIVNSRLVIRRQGGWLPALGRGQEGRGAPRPLSAPDGKLRAIGHMSKAMTGWGGGEGGGGSLLCLRRGRQGPGVREGLGVRKLQLRPGTLELAEPKGLQEPSAAGAQSPGGVSRWRLIPSASRRPGLT